MLETTGYWFLACKSPHAGPQPNTKRRDATLRVTSLVSAICSSADSWCWLAEIPSANHWHCFMPIINVLHDSPRILKPCSDSYISHSHFCPVHAWIRPVVGNVEGRCTSRTHKSSWNMLKQSTSSQVERWLDSTYMECFLLWSCSVTTGKSSKNAVSKTLVSIANAVICTASANVNFDPFAKHVKIPCQD